MKNKLQNYIEFHKQQYRSGLNDCRTKNYYENFCNKNWLNPFSEFR